MRVKLKGRFFKISFFGLEKYEDFFENFNNLLYEKKFIIKDSIETKLNENNYIKNMEFFENDEYVLSEKEKLNFIFSEEEFLDEDNLKKYQFIGLKLEEYDFKSHNIDFKNICIKTKKINLSRYTDFFIDEDLIYDLEINNQKVNLDQKRLFILPPNNKKINSKKILIEYDKTADLYCLDTIIWFLFFYVILK